MRSKDFQHYFYVAYAITIHKSQGSTFDFSYTIHEWDKLDNKLKYVALSRATDKEYINIRDFTKECVKVVEPQKIIKSQIVQTFVEPVQTKQNIENEIETIERRLQKFIYEERRKGCEPNEETINHINNILHNLRSKL